MIFKDLIMSREDNNKINVREAPTQYLYKYVESQSQTQK